ncbi:MAG: altronate dehydratase family protein [Bacteroidota bacterium]
MDTPSFLHIHPDDNVLVALDELPEGEVLDVDGKHITVHTSIPKGHKIALEAIEEGVPVVKFGAVIGHTTESIEPGAWVHSHNLETDLDELLAYTYAPVANPAPAPSQKPYTFKGYKRSNGTVGIRNEIWILNTVGCVNTSSMMIAQQSMPLASHPSIDGVHAFPHPFGCSQLGDDLTYTQRILAGLIHHPNVGGVLLLALGCENNQVDELLELAKVEDRSRIRVITAQEVSDEIEDGIEAIEELADIMKEDLREEVPASELTIGVKCGGSDGFSGLTANPLVGRITDKLTALGGRVVQTEVPEMFGAEQQLMNRAENADVFEDIVGLINNFKSYFKSYGQPVYENPSPGNKDGGITTLEEKSLGAIQKGGQATITDVLDYGERVRKPGLSLIYGPGNDGVSSTVMTASGANMVLFTTGRGTPLGFPAPTVKISTNTDLAERKPKWIDFDAGVLMDGTSFEDLTEAFFTYLLQVASGEVYTNNEKRGYREIAIWKDGVTL